MAGASGWASRPTGPLPARRWISIGLAVMFVLIGVAIVVAVVFPFFFSVSGARPFPGWPFGLFWGFLWILVLLWIASWFFRWSFWSWGAGWTSRHAHRWFEEDSAARIAQERYARGEISRDQFDQMMRDLEQRPGSR